MNNATSILVLICLMFGTNYYSYRSGHVKGMSEQAMLMSNASHAAVDSIHQITEEVKRAVEVLSPDAVDSKLAGMFSVSDGKRPDEDEADADSITKFESMCALCASTVQPKRRLSEPADAPMDTSVYGSAQGLASPPTFFEDAVGTVGISSME